MAQKLKNPVEPKWQVTATTIECSHIGDFVTIMVYKDWTSKCTWWTKHMATQGEGSRYRHSKEISAKVAKCEGPECDHVRAYLDKLMREEKSP